MTHDIEIKTKLVGGKGGWHFDFNMFTNEKRSKEIQAPIPTYNNAM